MPIQVQMVFNHFPRLREQMAVLAQEVCKEFADIVYEESQQRIPVDTGLQKSSGRVEEISKGYKIVYDAPNNVGQPYPVFIEYGTRYTRAQPFMNPAVVSASSRITGRVDAIAHRVLG